MSSPVNAFFKILLNGQQTGSTPELLVSGTLHCVEIPPNPPNPSNPSIYLPIAYYTDGATANENSLTNIRNSTDAFGYANGTLLPTQAGTRQRFKIETYGFTLAVYDTSGVVFATIPAPGVAPKYMYDWSIKRLDVMESLKVPVPSYNELDSDVVLTTASPTAWNRPQPIENDIVIKSNVLTLIYAALYKERKENDVTKYIILGNTTDFETDANTSIEKTRVWQFKNVSNTASPYNATSGLFEFDQGNDTTTRLSCARVDAMLEGIAPDLLQSNDTMDITVNGIDNDWRNLYTTTLTYTDSTPSENQKQYPSNLFAGLLEKNFAAYESKQAICIAVSKYNLGTGLNTTENPPFQFSYKKSGLFKVLDEVVLDFAKYYYIVYHFAGVGSSVRALPLFSRPTQNADALKDYVVIAGKNDAYVDLELPENKIIQSSSSAYSTFQVTSTNSSGATRVLNHTGPGLDTYQFFTIESELYGGGRTESAIFGKKRLRVHLGKLDATTIKIEIKAVYSDDNAKSFSGSISKRHILNLTDALFATAATVRFVELSKAGGEWDELTSTPEKKKAFNHDISQWDIKEMCTTATGKNFSDLLSGFESFNLKLGNWNTSEITSMQGMFTNAKSFNQPINTWNTAKVTSMVSMFEGATSFNQSIAGWNLTAIASTNASLADADSTGVAKMFMGASAFNGSVSSLITKAEGVSANSMFESATSFNQPFSSFRVSSCKAMFKNASAFNQPWRVNGSGNLIILETCTNLSEMFKNAVSLGLGSVFATVASHTLPTSVTTTRSMFEGASSWSCVLNCGSTNCQSLADVSLMYKGATSFNKPVTISKAADSLDCSNMFEGALRMNSHVVLPTSGSSVTLNEMFKNAVVFNKDVTFGVTRKISSAQRMFQGAFAYGNDDGNDASGSKPKPMLGSLGASNTRRYYIEYNDSQGVVTKPFEYMFDGTRFDDEVHGTGPADCSFMFAGASYFNTPLRSGFMTNATDLTGMFKEATSLQVSPFPDTAFLSNVENLTSTFEGATQFNADITDWGAAGKLNSQTLTSMDRMFHSATSFNQDLPTHWKSVSGASKNDAFTNASAYTFAKTWTA